MKWIINMRVKDYIRNWSNQEIITEYAGVMINIKIKDTNCLLILNGNHNHDKVLREINIKRFLGMCGQSTAYNTYATLPYTNPIFMGFSCSQNVLKEIIIYHFRYIKNPQKSNAFVGSFFQNF